MEPALTKAGSCAMCATSMDLLKFSSRLLGSGACQSRTARWARPCVVSTDVRAGSESLLQAVPIRTDPGAGARERGHAAQPRLNGADRDF